MDLILTNIKELATPTGLSAKKGKDQKQITIINNATVAVKDGKVAYVGEHNPEITGKKSIDCSEFLVTPGLVDSHTHLVFGGWRQHELALKLEGYSYLDILQQGGGILSTVTNTRKETEAELFTKGKKLVNEMLCHGTTTCEAKSGYGLNILDELKQLQVIKKLNETSIMDIVPTFLGAHAIPNEYKEDRDGFIKLVCEQMLPRVKDENLAEFCDIFCETAVFTISETRTILEEAKKYGFKLKMHGDEIDPIGGAELAASVSCISAEHLIQASDTGIKDMAKSDVIAVLLPATSFYLDKGYARARKMIDEGVAVAIATDFNPGSSPNLNMQLPMNLACLKYKLTPGEALTAVTLNAAAAIDRSESIGTIEVGKKADIVIWDAPDLNYIFYRYGTNLVKQVIKNGLEVEL